jgi:hypothetical protein
MASTSGPTLSACVLTVGASAEAVWTEAGTLAVEQGHKAVVCTRQASIAAVHP